MNKKVFKIILCVSVVALLLGIYLIAKNETPLSHYTINIEKYGDWEWISYEEYLESKEKVETCKALYNFGIVLTVLSGFSLLTGIVGFCITKNKKTVSNDIETYID